MKETTLNEYLRSSLKDNVAEYYYRVVSDEETKDYDKITKNKMIEAILKVYDNPANILDILTEREIEVLKSILEGNYTYNPTHYFRLDNLVEKLLVYKLDNKYKVRKDLKKQIQEALTNIDLEIVRKKDAINQLAVPYVKVMGSIYEKPLMNIVSELLGIDEEEIINHIQNNKLFNFYIRKEEKYNDLLNANLTEFYYIDYEDYLWELDLERAEYAIPATIKIDLNDFAHIFYNRINTNNEKIKEMFNTFCNKHYFHYLIKQMNLTVLLNRDHNEFFDELAFVLRTDYTAENLEIIDEAMHEMPSGALNGLTLNEYEKQLKEAEEIDEIERNEKQSTAHLDKKDCDLFYKLYLALLEYTNNTYQVNLSLKQIYKAKNINAQLVVPIAEYLWSNKHIIDEFITKNPYEFNRTELKILTEFKKGIRNMFIIAKFEKNYTIFIDEMGENVYKIKGLFSNIDEIIPSEDLPIYAKTTILPFKGYIIYDGLLGSMPINLGLEFKKMVKEKLKEHKYKEL